MCPQRSLTDFFSNHSLTLLPFLSAFASFSSPLHNWNHIWILNYSPFICAPQENIPRKMHASQVTDLPLSELIYFSHNKPPLCQQLISLQRPPRNSQGEPCPLHKAACQHHAGLPVSLTSTAVPSLVTRRGGPTSGFLLALLPQKSMALTQGHLGTIPDSSFVNTPFLESIWRFNVGMPGVKAPNFTIKEVCDLEHIR